ncbi:TetR/AcrR family transcriptional regulator [Streptomyces sp. MA15]|uniref:TetR/AcrR family transcriptional regulator n=1 Tax=unclassified Streptomyces TaxID=2593676 RepID=UPI0025B0D7FD|nr:TetR/AcrR family transcriptional regulator [Streptomyces sp. MA15]MDN3271898.1 TetR/AcrR family transcriptional regulator [Streptomyces sp. MA15]
MPDTIEQRPYHHGNLRTELLDAAERSLRAHGVERLSLRDLARDVGVSHAAPRRHFADRRALLDALAESGFVRLGARLRAAVDEIDDDDLAARLHAFASAYVRFATENAALTGLMNAAKHRPGATAVAEAAAAAFGQIGDLIEEGQSRGELEEGDPEEIGLVIYATVLGITSMLTSGMIGPGRLEGLVDTAVTQFLRGARPTEPH